MLFAPYPLIIGVTGHRNLRPEDEPYLRLAVREVLLNLIKMRPAARIALLSPLAEGADQLVAEEALRLARFDLFVPLPLSPEDYEQTFISKASPIRFRTLLSHAKGSDVVSPAEGTDHYTALGNYLVNNCQYLIALWDGVINGLPGGTADVVRIMQAKEHGTVFHIVTPRRGLLVPERAYETILLTSS